MEQRCFRNEVGKDGVCKGKNLFETRRDLRNDFRGSKNALLADCQVGKFKGPGRLRMASTRQLQALRSLFCQSGRQVR